MRRFIYFLPVLLLMAFINTNAQSYTFDDFVGTWHGTISATTFGGYSDPITMTIESDGYYTESSGHLMPTIYPNTQECEFDAPTNRFHWWYLDLVYSGQYFYQHFYYEIVYFSNDTLEMHYNFWDDPQPFPEAGIIFLVKENLTPAPSGLDFTLFGNNVVLTWDQPAGAMTDPDAYNVYHKLNDDDYAVVGQASSTNYAHEDLPGGVHSYFITAVYGGQESEPSNEVAVDVIISNVSDQSAMEVSLYPNPASDLIHVRSADQMQSIRIFNQSGTLVRTETPLSPNHAIDVSGLSSGLYFLMMESSDGALRSERVVVQ